MPWFCSLLPRGKKESNIGGASAYIRATHMATYAAHSCGHSPGAAPDVALRILQCKNNADAKTQYSIIQVTVDQFFYVVLLAAHFPKCSLQISISSRAWQMNGRIWLL